MENEYMNLEKVISSLRMNIEFGVDEAISEMPRNRLKEGVKENLLFKENFNRSVQKGSSALSQTQLMQAPITFDHKYKIAFDLASKCDTIDELFKAINSFPYFIKNNQALERGIYDGKPDPSILVLKEPEIFNMQLDKDLKMFDKNLLLSRIIRSIENTLGSGIDGFCASLISSPNFFERTEEATSQNYKLFQVFLLQYVNILKPRVVICIGGSSSNISFKNNLKDTNRFKDILTVDFPSLDILARAPKRKQDVWRKILDLKEFFGLDTSNNG